MMRMFTKTLALSLTVLGMTSTLALAQPDDITVRTGRRDSIGIAGSAGTSAAYRADREDPSWHQSWNHVGSGGSDLGLHDGRDPHTEPHEPDGVKTQHADP